MVIAAVAPISALLLPSPLADRGVFGDCFEGACGDAAVFVGFPAIWIALTVAGMIG